MGTPWTLLEERENTKKRWLRTVFVVRRSRTTEQGTKGIFPLSFSYLYLSARSSGFSVCFLHHITLLTLEVFTTQRLFRSKQQRLPRGDRRRCSSCPPPRSIERFAYCSVWTVDDNDEASKNPLPNANKSGCCARTAVVFCQHNRKQESNLALYYAIC